MKKELEDVINSAKEKLISTIISKLPHTNNNWLEVYDFSSSDRFKVIYIKEVYFKDGEVWVKAEEDEEEFEDSLDTFDINTVSEVCEWILK